MNDAFDARLAALRQRFRDRATAESAALEAIVSELESGVAGARLHTEIRRIAHSLAGAGGTFGFFELSACAAKLEDIVTDLPDSPEIAGACRALILEVRRSASPGNRSNGRQ